GPPPGPECCREAPHQRTSPADRPDHVRARLHRRGNRLHEGDGALQAGESPAVPDLERGARGAALAGLPESGRGDGPPRRQAAGPDRRPAQGVTAGQALSGKDATSCTSSSARASPAATCTGPTWSLPCAAPIQTCAVAAL